ncbi:hypothetical protein C3400_30480 [Klebsiella oxytoca]|nr:hypothetical protein C2U46_27035 [Klebsiella oxytoca]MBX4645146.1 hypothetical protein [Klebsiella michiganensis]POT58874.1 hypothetical protein C3412_30495 [Klebsiella oxytoca]POT81857.1 hypothetical protein C3416_30705 [Klebsiella oxytoca]POU90860.1 hypothetical protein C3400_30480 [Klebsiella oxytoca]
MILGRRQKLRRFRLKGLELKDTSGEVLIAVHFAIGKMVKLIPGPDHQKPGTQGKESYAPMVIVVAGLKL